MFVGLSARRTEGIIPHYVKNAVKDVITAVETSEQPAVLRNVRVW